MIFRSIPALVALLSALPALGATGALEINQTCATETGCFAGDAPGFPVTITTPGSYQLTGNLSVSTDTDATLVTASYVSLDLNGFEIAGVATCTGSGPTLSCSTGSGSGVFASGSPTGVTIRNGTIRNHPLIGIRAEGDGHRVENLLARHNGLDGINLELDALCTRCTALQNGRDGIRVNQGTVVETSVAKGNGREGIVLTGNGGVVSGCTSTGNAGAGIQLNGESSTVYGSSARENGGAGFALQVLTKYGKNNVSGSNGAEDSCGGRSCSERRRFYLEGAFESGTFVPSDFCDSGFRLLRAAELIDGQLAGYDGELTLTRVHIASQRYELSEGGSVGTNGFVCDEEPGGFRCSDIQSRGLTSGWHLLPPPQAPTFDPTICVEE